MNILIKSDNFSKNSVNYLETKPNMMFDGLFTKMNYCDDFMVMYGVYLDIPIQVIENNMKPIISSASFAVFQSIEHDILSGYLEYRRIKGNAICAKLSEYIQTKYDVCESCSGESLAILKISGIWENAIGEVGLSFKVVKA
jgi:hypothetical protein